MEKIPANPHENQYVYQLGEDAILQKWIRPMAQAIDDDAAELEVPPGQRLIVSTDALLEGIHFLRESKAEWVGEKALRATLSDLAASGAHPLWVQLSLSMPGNLPVSWLQGFCDGFAKALGEYGVALTGGDLTGSKGGIAISVTVMGWREPWEKVGRVAPLTRSGAKPGDLIYVSGCLGQTLPGLESLLGKRRLSSRQRVEWEARHFLTPDRTGLGRGLYQQNFATALMDLSDGLALDLPKLLKASGVGAVVGLNHVPVSDGFLELGYTRKDAVSAGEDYELLFTVSPGMEEALQLWGNSSGHPIAKIGVIDQGKEMRILNARGEETELEKSWQHF